MEKEACASFYVKFLGGFLLTFGGEKIIINKRLSQKSTQLLLILLKAGQRGMPWKKLVQMLGSGSEDLQKQHNNLRQQVRGLRRLIRESKGFPEGKYVVATQDGNYYFTMEYEIETDVGQIDQLYQRIRDGTEGEEQKALLLEICRLYTGEFLPTLLGEEWATVAGAGYQSIYLSCVQELCGILKKEKSYTEILDLCRNASRIYPYGQWNEVQIKCLMELNRYDEAAQVYEQATRDFYGELGVHPFPKPQNPDESGWIGLGDGNIAEALNGLIDQERRSCPYCCPYPSFVDICRVVSRNMERSRSRAALLLCTLKERNDLEQEMKELQNHLEEVMRSSDIYTRYSLNQFLALLPETEEEDGKKVIERLKYSWAGASKPFRATVKFELSQI